MEHFISGTINLKPCVSAQEIAVRLASFFNRDGIKIKDPETIYINCNMDTFSERELAKTLNGMSIYIKDGDIRIRTGSDGAGWRYRFHEGTERFIRESGRIVWEEKDPSAYCGRGRLQLADNDDGEFEYGRDCVLSSLNDLFSDVYYDYPQVSVSYEGSDFDPEYTAHCLKGICPFVKEGTICIGRADDGPDLKDIERWRYIFRDGEISCQEGSVKWE